MKKARTLLAIWLALILTLTLFPTALATGDGTEPDSAPAPSTYTISLQYDSNAIQAPTQSVTGWTEGNEAPYFTFTLSDGYDKPTATVTIGNTAVADAYTLTGPDATGKYTLTLKTEKINGDVGVSLSAAKVEEPSTPPAIQGGDSDPNGGEPTTPSPTFSVSYYTSTSSKEDLEGVTGKPQGATGLSDGDTYTISPEIPQRAKFKFMYWSPEPNDNRTRYLPGDKIEIKSDVSLYAWWEAAVDIKFDLDGGAGNAFSPDKKALKDGSYMLPSERPQKNGYIFTGWSNGADTYQPGSTYKFTSDSTGYATTFTAQWKKAMTVNYVKDGGNVGNMPNPSTITVE